MAYSVKGKGKYISRMRRYQRMRKHIFGSAGKPRLAVTRPNRRIIVQLIDDYVGKTLVSASTMEDILRAPSDKKVDKAHEVSKLIIQHAKVVGTAAIVFDRGGNKYHGRVAAVAEDIREGGLGL